MDRSSVYGVGTTNDSADEFPKLGYLILSSFVTFDTGSNGRTDGILHPKYRNLREKKKERDNGQMI